MSLNKEKERLLTNVKAYKESLPPPPPPEALLPNNAARANQTQRTRQQRHGSTGLTSAGQAALSKPKK